MSAAATRTLIARLGSPHAISACRPAAALPRLSASARFLQTTPASPALVLPITAHGAPPAAPSPARSQITEFRARQKAESSRIKRFWKEVHVVETDGSRARPYTHPRPR